MVFIDISVCTQYNLHVTWENLAMEGKTTEKVSVNFLQIFTFP